ncbi:DUF4012 domain-containing protein [Sanguibacter antarcticus]|uniref:Uncharacterized protein DUF4012 n=1 Tax=Sanguibacter antarcticus TaxID=372484 RepID=A0A2A9E262_9MICO|nr:DUF4012 domain-containing protein [Sanguibacter antarcticus]PFG32279.1 uncharacterized protein DUF4012 [Sanguibacter antarcticus]
MQDETIDIFGEGSGPGDQAPRRPRHRALKIVAFSALGLVIVTGALAAWVGYDLLSVRSSLTAASDLVPELQDEIAAGDGDAALATLAEVQDHAQDAEASSHGFHWSVVSLLPVARPNIQAVQVVTEVVESLAVDALPALTEAAVLVGPDGLSPVDGQIDLAPLVASAPQLIAADLSLRRGLADLRAVETDEVLDPLADAVTDLESTMSDIASTTSTAARAVQIAPAMLGADGPRRFLLLVQNNAEPRATGGIPAWVILLTADDGVLQFADQRSASEFQPDAPVLPITDAERALFGDDLAQKMADVNFTPDFPRTAELASALWQQQDPGEIDGVLSLDPVALADIMKTTGSLSLPFGPQLDADNVADYLMNGVYLQIADKDQQDALFQLVAAAMFAQILNGPGEISSAFPALADSADEGRLMLWSAHPDEQELLQPTALSGALVGDAADSDGGADRPIVGVYLNDGTAGKIGYYLERSITADVTECRADGSQALKITLSLTSTAPADAATLPEHVTGVSGDVPPGDIRTNVLVYAPAGGQLESVTAGGEPVGIQSQLHDDLFVAGLTNNLSPGESEIYEYEIVTGPDQRGVPLLRFTPGPRDTHTQVTGATCNGA